MLNVEEATHCTCIHTCTQKLQNKDESTKDKSTTSSAESYNSEQSNQENSCQNFHSRIWNWGTGWYTSSSRGISADIEETSLAIYASVFNLWAIVKALRNSSSPIIYNFHKSYCLGSIQLTPLNEEDDNTLYIMFLLRICLGSILAPWISENHRPYAHCKR